MLKCNPFNEHQRPFTRCPALLCPRLRSHSSCIAPLSVEQRCHCSGTQLSLEFTFVRRANKFPFCAVTPLLPSSLPRLSPMRERIEQISLHRRLLRGERKKSETNNKVHQQSQDVFAPVQRAIRVRGECNPSDCSVPRSLPYANEEKCTPQSDAKQYWSMSSAAPCC